VGHCALCFKYTRIIIAKINIPGYNKNLSFEGEIIMNPCIAFEGARSIASGEILTVARQVKKAKNRDSESTILIFDSVTSEQIEIDFRGNVNDVVKRLANKLEKEKPPIETASQDSPEPRGPGRPKLGVIAREVTLLPRHWEWLNTQPGGASVALRKLVEKARHDNAGQDRLREAQNAAYRFMSVMAGNEPGFEEAMRALFAADEERFHKWIRIWPDDIQSHSKSLAAAVFGAK
jgi:hypothetical protein